MDVEFEEVVEGVGEGGVRAVDFWGGGVLVWRGWWREREGGGGGTFFDAEVELEGAGGFVAGHEGDVLELALVVGDLGVVSVGRGWDGWSRWGGSRFSGIDCSIHVRRYQSFD